MNLNPYLSGEAFSSALYFPFSPHTYEDLLRPDKIVEIVKNKRVIHIGCCDHLSLIEEKLKKNRWLHQLLVDHTQQCMGIDNDREAVAYVSEKLNIKNVYCVDILKDDIDLGSDVWDYVILGEVIEHVDNPVEFLQTVRFKFQKKAKKIIVTAPHVFNIYHAKYMKKNIECINTDHRYWFSPFTLSKIMALSGFTNHQMTFAQTVPLPFFKEVIRHLKKRMNIMRYYPANHFLSIILVADF